MRPSSTEDYSYPNLRLQLQEHHNPHTSDGYIIVQPDQCVRENTQENVCADMENCGPRGAMDDTLWTQFGQEHKRLAKLWSHFLINYCPESHIIQLEHSMLCIIELCHAKANNIIY